MTLLGWFSRTGVIKSNAGLRAGLEFYFGVWKLVLRGNEGMGRVSRGGRKRGRQRGGWIGLIGFLGLGKGRGISTGKHEADEVHEFGNSKRHRHYGRSRFRGMRLAIIDRLVQAGPSASVRQGFLLKHVYRSPLLRMTELFRVRLSQKSPMELGRHRRSWTAATVAVRGSRVRRGRW